MTKVIEENAPRGRMTWITTPPGPPIGIDKPNLAPNPYESQPRSPAIHPKSAGIHTISGTSA